MSTRGDLPLSMPPSAMCGPDGGVGDGAIERDPGGWLGRLGPSVGRGVALSVAEPTRRSRMCGLGVWICNLGVRRWGPWMRFTMDCCCDGEAGARALCSPWAGELGCF